MEKIKTLIGLKVRVYLDTHTVDGILEVLDDEKIIINADNSFFLIFKSKINMVLLNPEEVIKEKVVQNQSAEYYKDTEVEVPPPFEENGVAERNQYGSILPITLLEQQPKDPSELIDRLFDQSEPEPDFSISMSSLRNENALLARAERQRIMEKNKKDLEDGSSQ